MQLEPGQENDQNLSELTLPERGSLHQEHELFSDALRAFAALGIERDEQRFRDIVKGKVREDLGKYMSSDELIHSKNGDKVRIPIPHIDTPRFKHGSDQDGGVGQGEGEVGDSIGKKGQKPGEEPGEGAGEGKGNHRYEEFSLDELAQLMAEVLQLPRIEPKGNKSIQTEDDKYNSIAKQGPPGQKHMRRTLKQALLRQISSGEYDPDDPNITVIKEDERYRSPTLKPKPQSNAAIIYVMDVSGSMESGQKDVARLVSFWIDVWLRSQYEGIETIFIIHDEEAKEVNRDEFFTTSASGGTKISSAYDQILKVMDRFPPEEWNLYLFQFSDGDNWPREDDEKCAKLLKEKILPNFNQVAYGQIPSQNGGYPSKEYNAKRGFYQVLDEAFKSEKKMVVGPIYDKSEVLPIIKKFFEKGN